MGFLVVAERAIVVFSNYSVEASVLENGKLNNGVLTLFEDEYVFAGKGYKVDWEKVTYSQGNVKVKSFLRTIERPSLTLSSAGAPGPELIFNSDKLSSLIEKIDEIKSEKASARQAAEAKAQEEAERAQEAKQREIEEEHKRQRELFEAKRQEKKNRIQTVVANAKEGTAETVAVEGIAKKAASLFLENPYRILGIPCTASTEEANSSLDKLKKLARLNAVSSYTTPFDVIGIERPSRDLSVAQNALSQMKDQVYRLLWFQTSDACFAWQNSRYRTELERDGFEYGDYDLFLANYFYAVITDPNFETAESWKRIFRFYCYLLRENKINLLRSRFPAEESERLSDTELIRSFRNSIFKPILSLCSRDDLDATLRLYKYIQDCDDEHLKDLSAKLLTVLTTWFNDKESSALHFLSENTYNKESLSYEEGESARAAGETYCKAVEPVLGVALRSFRVDAAKHDIIKESYRHVTYQFMYELNKCTEKTNAIYFANKCYGYCTADDKQRIKNTFGEANIKAIDWNVPHSGWDAKGDDYFFGRGCEVDYVQALNWYHKAADAGNMHSQNSLGLCYKNGTGVPQDIDIAVQWFEKAYKSGNPEGAYNLAECYYSGEGKRQNVDKALEYWAEADKLGHPTAGARREGVFSQVQANRRAKRASNHICIDLGFQMPMGSSIFAEVTMSGKGYAYLVNAQGYQNYLDGNTFRSTGGYATESPYRIPISSSNHWYVIVDNGDEPLNGLTATAKVKK